LESANEKMNKFRLAYLIFGSFLLLYLFLYNPKQPSTNFQSYISNFNPEKTIVGRFILAPINIKFIVPPKEKYYCGDREIDKKDFDLCMKYSLHKMGIRKMKDAGKLIHYLNLQRPHEMPQIIDSNHGHRIRLMRAETYFLLICFFVLLWFYRFKATEGLRNFYKKI
jgi:hypothetical protein|tara:strand:+ start:627 stop:1127 length:501 start_codon:yes stop_codon:yes gene_type:complete